MVPPIEFDEEHRALLGELIRFPDAQRLHPVPTIAFVHDACPLRDGFVDGIVAKGPSEQLLAVYEDALLERGDGVRAEFVGVARARLKANVSKRHELTVRLRQLRDELPGTWCRAVLVGDGSSVRRLE